MVSPKFLILVFGKKIGYPSNERALSLLHIKIQVLDVLQCPRCSRPMYWTINRAYRTFARWGKFAVIRLVQMVPLEFEYSQTRLYRTRGTTKPFYIESFSSHLPQ